MPTISVIIPNFNRENLVGETIQNMLGQSLPPHEIIVVDDGSTDGSVDVIRSFGSRVTLIQQENKGPGAARNAGLAVATGDYIQFMDSDDLASHNKLEVQVAALEQNQADMAYSPWAKVYIENKSVAFQDHVLQKQPLPQALSILEWFLSGWSIVLQTCLFRRHFLSKIEPFRTDLLVWEDGDFMVRLFSLIPKIAFVPECLTLYRLHSYQKLTESGTSDLRRLQDRVSTYPEFCQIINNYSPNLKYIVRLNLGLDAWKLWNSMQQFPSFSIVDMNKIKEMWNFYPSFVWYLFSYFRRGMIRLRWHNTGSRWIRPYQSCFPSEMEYTLIRAIGLKIS
ncbi:glycosyltransferase family 2 protein [Nodularia sp. UHCC 0506]|uniref:glycosyltransferase family 2 protein n=1 Tax=Nodularia sp. UHCC 0506 TaxID=3110243 RepID=UPI002B216D55|nr:glycosyltransferase [Nodularia sp. UHCC 0506]MEA5516908.1 glycosyltransferase [Nodularia sp. UHCC 0506]